MADAQSEHGGGRSQRSDRAPCDAFLEGAFGCDGWIGVNLYPFISSDPKDMWRWANWEAHGPAWDVRDALLGNVADIEDAGRIATMKSATGRLRITTGGRTWDRHSTVMATC